MKYIEWKNLIALAALIYSISFAFQVYLDHTVAQSNLKLRITDLFESKLKYDGRGAIGDKEVENFKKFIWNTINN